jgi:hypothetical protein
MYNARRTLSKALLVAPLLTLRNAMSVENSARKAGDEWRAIVRKHGSKEFAAAFVAEPVLYASVLNGPCVGIDAIAAFFAATSAGMYESLAFTNETVDGLKTYLEWEGKAFGKDVGGTTVLTRNEADLIQSVRLYHRPLQVVVLFSEELAKRLQGKVDPSLLSTAC